MKDCERTLQRIEALRDGRGWYPSRVCGDTKTIAFSSDGRANVIFWFPSAEETLLACVEYCEWMNERL